MRLNKIKQSFLATAITLSLATGTGYAADIAADALPTGGVAVEGMGTITGLDNVAGGITLTGDSGIIDWSTFNIGEKATLTFNLSDGTALLNRVGADGGASYLLGTLTSENGTLILSNPNGIVVGDGATFDVNSMMLTTMSISNDQFKDLFNGKEITLTDKNNSLIDIKTKANFNVKELLQIFGGSVTIADDVVITDGNKGSNTNTNISVAAIESGDIGFGKEDYNSNIMVLHHITSGDNNNMKIGATALGTEESKAVVNLYGGNIDLNGTKINSYYDVDIHAENISISNADIKATNDVIIKNNSHYDSGALVPVDETLNLDTVNIDSGNIVKISGANISLNNTNVTAKDNIAIHPHDYDENDSDFISISGGSLKTDGNIDIEGNKISIDGATLDSKKDINLTAYEHIIGENIDSDIDGANFGSKTTITTEAANIIDINDANLTANAISVVGRSISVKDSNVDGGSNGYYFQAVNKSETVFGNVSGVFGPDRGNANCHRTADSENILTITDSTFKDSVSPEGNDSTLFGGQVSIKNSDISGKDLSVIAITDHYNRGGGWTATNENTVDIIDSDIAHRSHAYINGGKIFVTGSNLNLHDMTIKSSNDVDIHGENVTMKDTNVSAGDEIKVEGWGESINISGGELLAMNDVQIKGHNPGIKVNIENATLTAEDDVEIHAGERVGNSGAEGITATYANAINIKGLTTISAGNDVAIRGGAVNIDKSILLANDAVEINAFYEGSEPAEGMKFDAGSKNIVNINGSTLATNENAVTILGGVVNITGGKMDTKELNVAALRHLESVDREPNMEKITVSDKSVVTIGSDVKVDGVKLTVIDKRNISNVVADYNPEPSVGPDPTPTPVIPTDEEVEKVLEDKPAVESFEKYVEVQPQSMEGATTIVNTIVASKDLSNAEKAAYAGAVVKGNAALSEVSNGTNDKVNSESSNNGSAAAVTETSTTPASSTESEDEDVTIN